MELQKIERDLEKAVDAILAGAPPLTLKERRRSWRRARWN
jgi:uncharacterized iron-regulated protein